MPPPKLAWPLLALSLAAAATAGAQCPPGPAPASQARFAAVSIRNASPASFQPTETDPGHMRISGLSLRRIIMTAYALRPDQIVGGPAWLNADAFLIVASTPRPSTRAQEMRMLQNALVERFHLACHELTQPEKVLVLTAPQGDAKLTPLAAGAVPRPPGPGQLSFTTVAGLVGMLNTFAEDGMINHPVVDQTGLHGRYELRLTLGGSNGAGEVAIAPRQGNLIVSQLDRQFGLRLVGRTEPVLHLIVDHVTPPTAN